MFASIIRYKENESKQSTKWYHFMNFEYKKKSLTWVVNHKFRDKINVRRVHGWTTKAGICIDTEKA
jgi:hypothetical protein